MKPRVSIIISNRNDVAMLAITVRSCIEELRPLGPGSGEIVICDNSDQPVYNLLQSVLPTGYCQDEVLKIIHQPFPCLFSARELAAKESSGEYILCLDSHVLLGRDCIVDLVNFMDRHSTDPSLGFAHAPISWIHQHEKRARHDRDLSKNELGDWNSSYSHERTITWKGMPWICRRSWFLDKDKGLNGYGALADHHISWGGGDMHIGTKPWLLGFKNWAVPTNPIAHIGPFPKIDLKTSNSGIVSTVRDQRDGYKYRLYSESGKYPHTFGFLVSCYILGGEPMMYRNKDIIKSRFGQFLDVERWWAKAIELGEGEKLWLDAHKVMTYEQFLASKPWEQDNCLKFEQTA